jgi:hypothetical protein
MRMENTRTTRKITEWTSYKTRPAGRSRLRWMDKVEDIQEWNRIVEQTKTHPGL